VLPGSYLGSQTLKIFTMAESSVSGSTTLVVSGLDGLYCAC